MSPSKSLRSSRPAIPEDMAVDSNSAPAGATLRSSKRKAAEGQKIDSDYDAVSVSMPGQSESPKKKRRTAAHADPGSPEYDSLPPVSIAASSKRAKVAKKLSFGSVDDNSGDVESPSSNLTQVSKQSRRRVPTEKALYMAEESSPKRKASNTHISPKKAPAVSSSIVSSDSETIPTPALKRTNRAALKKGVKFEENFESDEVSDGTRQQTPDKKTDKMSAKGEPFSSPAPSNKPPSLTSDIIEIGTSDSESRPPVTPMKKKRHGVSVKKAVVKNDKAHVVTSDEEPDLPVPPSNDTGSASRKKAIPDTVLSSDEDSDLPVNPSIKVGSASRKKAVSKIPESGNVSVTTVKEKRVLMTSAVEIADDSDASLPKQTPDKKAKGKATDPSASLKKPLATPKGKTAVKDLFADDVSDSNDGLSEHERAERNAKTVKNSNPFIDDEADDMDVGEVKRVRNDKGKMQSIPDDPVMRADLQDDRLKSYYDNLPKLNFCDVRPFSSLTNSGQGDMLLYSPIFESLTAKEDQIRLRHGINFISHNHFVNPARISPNLISKQNARLVMADNQQTAVFLSVGAVSSCNLIRPGIGGFLQTNYHVKNIMVYLFSQEYERSVSLLGTVYGQKHLYGPISNGALTFSTRKEGSAYNNGATPPKPKRFFNSSGLSSSRQGGSSYSYPQNLAFEDTVPIYDGRALDGGRGFDFRGVDFDSVRQLPLYQQGTIDLPPWAVVAVGYSVNTYPYSSRNHDVPPGSLALSPNVLFAIVLGITDEVIA